MSHTLPRLVLRYAQTSCAGQEERTVAPHCRRSAARFTLTLCSGRCPCPLPAVRGQRSVNTLFNAPTHSPRCRCAAPLRLRPSRSIGARKCITCGSRLAMDGVCPSAYAFSVASRGSACFAALTPDCGHYKSQCSTSCRATPMAHLHTLLRLNRLLPCLRFTAHRHRLITNHVQGECRVKLA